LEKEFEKTPDQGLSHDGLESGRLRPDAGRADAERKQNEAERQEKRERRKPGVSRVCLLRRPPGISDSWECSTTVREKYTGGYSEPVSETLLIRNCGGQILNWEIVENSNWLKATPQEGASTGEVDEVTLTADSSFLLPGHYCCILKVVDSNATNNPVEVPVKLRIGGLLCVPQQFPTVQGAVETANDYDLVLVADGIYAGDGNRDIDFSGKAITVRSESGPENCIIDCNATEDEHHRGFRFTNGESRVTVLDGFTIINGCTPMGGGIFCYASSPTITNCIIRCSAMHSGGGIYCSESGTTITNCTVTAGSAEFGGGIFCGGSGRPIGFDRRTGYTISSSTISGNFAEKANKNGS